MTEKRKIILAVTGASGSLYARLLAERLLAFRGVELSAIVTENGAHVMRFEDNDKWLDHPKIRVFNNSNLFEPPASGSARFDSMVIVPCSMGTLGRIASGVSSDLVCRAADVLLKERRRVILVTREAPVSTIHLRNMLTLSECGAIVCPACPSFYQKPVDIECMCNALNDRILSLLGLETDGYVWGETPDE